jgi:hypothetical protein
VRVFELEASLWLFLGFNCLFVTLIKEYFLVYL